MKNPRVSAQQFLSAIARGIEKGLIDVFDVRVDIGNDNGRRTLLHRMRQLEQLVFDTLALSDIAHDGGDEPLRAALPSCEREFQRKLAAVLAQPMQFNGLARVA